jgi:hypothetical protein
MSDTYKPSEHDGLKQDGSPDKRMEQTGMCYSTCLLPSNNPMSHQCPTWSFYLLPVTDLCSSRVRLWQG